MPIPDSYTVPQSYQPRRPETMPPSDPAWTHHVGPIPVSAQPASTHAAPSTSPSKTPSTATPENWNHYLAAGAFLAAGALLATGHRRLGIAAAAAGAATVLLDDREAVAALCQQVPGYLAEVQSLISQADHILRSCFPDADYSRQ